MAKTLLIAALASLTLITSAHAQDYPTRPLTMLEYAFSALVAYVAGLVQAIDRRLTAWNTM